MRITFVLPHADTSGGFRVIAIYAQRLTQRGHTVTVVSLPPPPLSLRSRARMLLKEGRLPLQRPGPSHLDTPSIDRRILSSHRPITENDVPDADVIIATWWETAEWIAPMSPAKGAKAYLIQHYETWGGPKSRVDATWRLPFQKIIISKWLMDLAVNQFDDPTAVHVPNSVDLDQFHAPPRSKQPHPTVGIQYSSTHWKGADICLRALDLVRRELPDLHLIAFGHAPPVPELPLPPNSHYTTQPPQDHLRDLYARCDVWLCGSRAEGFHLPPLEAMACRCPVVSTKVGGPMDIIQDGVNGYLVDIEDASALADRLLRVLRTTQDQWTALSNAALASAQRFSWDEATDLFEAALIRAVEQQQCPAGV